MPKLPYFMVGCFDQFTKILPYELWLMIYDVIRKDFKAKQEILKDLELLTLYPSEYCPFHYVAESKRSITFNSIMIPIPAIQFEVTYTRIRDRFDIGNTALVYISKTYAFPNGITSYYLNSRRKDWFWTTTVSYQDL